MRTSFIVWLKRYLDRIIGIPLVGISIPLLLGSDKPLQVFYPWILASLIVTALAWTAAPFAIKQIDKRYPWQRHAFRRVISLIGMLLLIGSLMSFVLYLAGELYFHLNKTPEQNIRLVPSYFISFLMLFFITALYELHHLFVKWKQSIVETERLEKEKALSQYQALKNQVNPHFLFNSLSVLSSLIYPEPQPEKAKRYLDEFAKIYRYVLEVNEEMVVTLERELNFLQSFFYLLQIRYAQALKLHVNVPADKLQMFLPPLTLQLLMENVSKHNQIDAQHEVTVQVYTQSNLLYVTNNLHPKNPANGHSQRRKVALENLKGRYRLIADEQPEFYHSKGQFVCKIPLIEAE